MVPAQQGRIDALLSLKNSDPGISLFNSTTKILSILSLVNPAQSPKLYSQKSTLSFRKMLALIHTSAKATQEYVPCTWVLLDLTIFGYKALFNFTA